MRRRLHAFIDSGRVAAAILVLVSSPSLLGAQTRSITVAWDPPLGSGVAGYVVYVGAEPGTYSDRFDVGNQTSFVLPDVVEGKRYYVAVAAYAEGKVIGARSAEVSNVPNATPSSTRNGAPVDVELLASETRVAPATVTAPPSAGLCMAGSTTDCYLSEILAHSASPIAALSSATDGRIFFIEAGSRVRVIADGAVVSKPALTVDRTGARLVGLALAADFEKTRLVYVAETTPRGDGSRELTLLRYRELQNTLAEGAAVVTGLVVSSSEEAAFAVGPAGIYIAVPTLGDSSATDPYQETVLHLNLDGTVPSDRRAASPVFANGLAHPARLRLDARVRQIWLSGTNRDARPLVLRVPLDGVDTSGWPRVPTAAFSELDVTAPRVEAIAASTDDYALYLVGSSGPTIFRWRPGAPSPDVLTVDGFGDVIAIDTAPGETLHVVTRSAVEGKAGYVILRLQRP